MRRTAATLASLSALTIAATGCSAFSDDGPEGVTVSAAFYPLQYVADRVAGDHAEVTALTAVGKEPHDLELTVKETALVADADLVVYEHGFQPAVDDAVEQNAEGRTVDAAEVVDLLPFEDHEGHDEHEDEDHAADGEKGHEEEGHDEHDHGEDDPHFWQDPVRMAELGDAVADELAEIDPDHADDYRANAEDLRADLETLDEEFATGLADCERDTIVVSHDAFGYLEKYGLHLASIVGLSPDAEPTPAVLGELQELIETEGITTVFSERLAPREFAKPLADDLGIDSAVLDPLEGLTDQTTDEDYLSLMRTNLAALREANGCR